MNRGLYWYEKAAEQYHVDAFYDLGFIWSKGLTGIRNIEKGIHWFKQAALQGDPEAKLQLGHIYNKAEGIPRNIKEAKKNGMRLQLKRVSKKPLLYLKN